MIYSFTFSALHRNLRITSWTSQSLQDRFGIGGYVNFQALAAKAIKQSENDSFIFILAKTSKQDVYFEEFLCEYKLKNLIVRESGWITNDVHLDQPNNIKMVVLMSPKHWYRDLMPLDKKERKSRKIFEDFTGLLADAHKSVYSVEEDV